MFNSQLPSRDDLPSSESLLKATAIALLPEVPKLLALRNPEELEALNQQLAREASARSVDPTTVQISLPARYNGEAVALMTDIEQLRVRTDQPAP